jgi:glycosyltransferase involved in cell wall biosynthesis
MRPLLVSRSDTNGGAAKAAYRLHRSLIANGIDSAMLVDDKGTDDETVRGPTTLRAKIGSRVRPQFESRVSALAQPSDGMPRSTGMFGGLSSARITAANADLVNLHWICGGQVSLRQIARIRKPLVWTFHDMWPICGREHYADTNAGWRTGYDKLHSRDFLNPDLDGIVWHLKQRWLPKELHVVCPSRWLAGCVTASPIAAEWKVTTIPNPLRLDLFKPHPRQFARHALGLDPEAPTLLFGAVTADAYLKGGDLLREAVHLLAGRIPDLRVAVVGRGSSRLRFPCATDVLGPVGDDRLMALAYAAADVTVVASRHDNLPQFGTEAQASGCPVVGFRVGGMPDVVEHGRTGILADPFEVQGLAFAIETLLVHSDIRQRMSLASRERALSLWSPADVASQYTDFFEEALARSRRIAEDSERTSAGPRRRFWTRPS